MKKTSIKGAIQDLSKKATKETAKVAQDALSLAQQAIDAAGNATGAHPVGSVYISTLREPPPSELFGGEWEEFDMNGAVFFAWDHEE